MTTGKTYSPEDYLHHQMQMKQHQMQQDMIRYKYELEQLKAMQIKAGPTPPTHPYMTCFFPSFDDPNPREYYVDAESSPTDLDYDYRRDRFLLDEKTKSGWLRDWWR